MVLGQALHGTPRRTNLMTNEPVTSRWRDLKKGNDYGNNDDDTCKGGNNERIDEGYSYLHIMGGFV